MSPEITASVLAHFFNSFDLPFTGSVPQWLNKFQTLEDGKKFNIGICPWLDEVYAAIVSPDYDVVIMEGAAGTYKTGVLDTIIPYWIVNDSGKVLRIHHRDEVATDFTKTRLVPMLENCPPVKSLFDGKIRATHNLILLPHMDVKASGPSEKIQYGYSCKFLQIDEAHNIKEPFENYFKRVRKNYGRTKIVISSTPGEQIFKAGKLVGDELALLVNSGVIKRRAWKCPKCSNVQAHYWSTKHQTKEKEYGGINFPDGPNSARLSCCFCDFRVEDSPAARIQLEQSASYVAVEQDGNPRNPRIITFQWPAWVAPFNSFSDSATQYVKAKELASAHLYDKLKEFYQQVAGEEWTNKIVKISSKLTYQQFDSNAEWPEEKFRFMGVDLQADGRRYYLIVAFDGIGNGRVISYGVCHSWMEIEQLAVRHKVQKPDGENAHFVGIDCGYDWPGVAKESVLHGKAIVYEEGGQEWQEHLGWLCLRGDQKPSFTWPDTIERAVSPQEWYDTMPNHPPARYHFWSNKAVKNLVASIRDGHNKLKLAVNTEDENLQRQLYSEHPDEFGDWKIKVKGSENHLWDCLCECYAMALLAGVPFFGDEKVPKS